MPVDKVKRKNNATNLKYVDKGRIFGFAYTYVHRSSERIGDQLVMRGQTAIPRLLPVTDGLCPQRRGLY